MLRWAATLAPWYRSFGGLRITANVKVVVSSRIYSQPGSTLEGSTGQFFAGIPASFAIGAGVAVGLVTDGSASSNDLSLWVEMNSAAKLHKLTNGDPTIVTASCRHSGVRNRPRLVAGPGESLENPWAFLMSLEPRDVTLIGVTC
jgi:hypothetical protein